jgi:hypothetical protein
VSGVIKILTRRLSSLTTSLAKRYLAFQGKNKCCHLDTNEVKTYIGHSIEQNRPFRCSQSLYSCGFRDLLRIQYCLPVLNPGCSRDYPKGHVPLWNSGLFNSGVARVCPLPPAQNGGIFWGTAESFGGMERRALSHYRGMWRSSDSVNYTIPTALSQDPHPVNVAASGLDRALFKLANQDQKLGHQWSGPLDLQVLDGSRPIHIRDSSRLPTRLIP